VAEQVLALIDTDRDGTVSTNETRAYCDKLKRHLLVKLDDRNVELKPGQFPPVKSAPDQESSRWNSGGSALSAALDET
jgi:hypothetical protein